MGMVEKILFGFLFELLIHYLHIFVSFKLLFFIAFQVLRKII